MPVCSVNNKKAQEGESESEGPMLKELRNIRGLLEEQSKTLTTMSLWVKAGRDYSEFIYEEVCFLANIMGAWAKTQGLLQKPGAKSGDEVEKLGKQVTEIDVTQTTETGDGDETMGEPEGSRQSRGVDEEGGDEGGVDEEDEVEKEVA
jgi:hypothetical protein